VAMHIKKLKVRPRKSMCSSRCDPFDSSNVSVIAPFETPCGPALQGMLNCMAAKGDVHALDACEGVTQELFDCMRHASIGKQRPRYTINYHLMKLQKLLK
ncbi:hypothetical protein DAEQUDRAFT_676869, partial [Daedalea quercina L-15889]